MRYPMIHAAKAFALAAFLLPATTYAQPDVKEWTLLTFLNGHNNLDSFGAMDINEMETVGSTDQVNVVVQWASLAAATTQRLYVTKDNDKTKVSSVVVEDLPRVDMGDWKSLVEFARWGMEKFPAKKYFINVWNHGSGWHMLRINGNVTINDISFDDLTGHNITTAELGQAMKEIAKLSGSKIEMYGSDACLMAMVDVAAEMSDAVRYFAGSQDLEPGEGWDYAALLSEWTKNPTLDGGEVGKILTRSYVASYSGGSQGKQDVTFSVYNLDHMGTLQNAVKAVTEFTKKGSSADRDKLRDAAKAATHFFYNDYRDLGMFVRGAKGFSSSLTQQLDRALGDFVVAQASTAGYAPASGVSIWFPTSKREYDTYAKLYSQSAFHAATGWGDALKLIANK